MSRCITVYRLSCIGMNRGYTGTVRMGLKDKSRQLSKLHLNGNNIMIAINKGLDQAARMHRLVCVTIGPLSKLHLNGNNIMIAINKGLDQAARMHRLVCVTIGPLAKLHLNGNNIMIAINKGLDQTARMHRLVCICVGWNKVRFLA